MPHRNVGGLDRCLRIVVGVALLATALALAAAGDGHAWTVGIVGGLALASGALGFCPPYVLLGISTARRHAPQSRGDGAQQSRSV